MLSSRYCLIIVAMAFLMIPCGHCAEEKQGQPDAELKIKRQIESVKSSKSRIAQLKLSDLYIELGELYCSKSAFQAASEEFARSLALRREQHADPVEIAAALSYLGDAYREQGKFQPSEKYLTESLAIVRKISPGSLDDAAATNRLALLYDNWGQFAKAEGLERKAFDMAKKHLKPDDEQIGIHNALLADTLRQQGKYAEAMPYLLNAVRILGKSKTPTRVYAVAVNNLGALYFWQGDYSKSEPLLLKGLALRKQLLGADHVDVANSLGDLGALYYQQSKYEDATKAFEDALRIRQTKLGPHHPLTASLMSNLANVYATQGQHDKAKSMLLKAVAIGEKTFGGKSPDLAQCLNDLAEVYVDERNFTEAGKLYQRALAIRIAAFGKNNPDVAATLRSLARLNMEKGDFSSASRYVQDALKTYRTVDTADHPDIADTLDLLGDLNQRQKRTGQARAAFVEALAIRNREKAPDRMAMAVEGARIADAYSLEGDKKSAKQYYEKSINFYRQCIGPSLVDPAVPPMLERYAELLGQLKDTQEQERWAKKAAEIKSQLAGRKKK